jgi:hypothetical protein
MSLFAKAGAMSSSHVAATPDRDAVVDRPTTKTSFGEKSSAFGVPINLGSRNVSIVPRTNSIKFIELVS